MTGPSDFLLSKNSNNTNSYLVSQGATIFSGKSIGNVTKRSAFKSWLLHPVIVLIFVSHDLPVSALSSEKLSLLGLSSPLVSITAHLFLPTDYSFIVLFTILSCFPH